MSDAVKGLLEAALALPEGERRDLISALQATVSESDEPAFDADLLAEINRRSDEFDAGNVRAVPWHQIKQRK